MSFSGGDKSEEILISTNEKVIISQDDCYISRRPVAIMVALLTPIYAIDIETNVE